MVGSGTFFPELVDEIEKEKKEDEDKDKAWGQHVKSKKSTKTDKFYKDLFEIQELVIWIKYFVLKRNWMT